MFFIVNEVLEVNNYSFFKALAGDGDLSVGGNISITGNDLDDLQRAAGGLFVDVDQICRCGSIGAIVGRRCHLDVLDLGGTVVLFQSVAFDFSSGGVLFDHIGADGNFFHGPGVFRECAVCVSVVEGKRIKSFRAFAVRSDGERKTGGNQFSVIEALELLGYDQSAGLDCVFVDDIDGGRGANGNGDLRGFIIANFNFFATDLIGGLHVVIGEGLA